MNYEDRESVCRPRGEARGEEWAETPEREGNISQHLLQALC